MSSYYINSLANYCFQGGVSHGRNVGDGITLDGIHGSHQRGGSGSGAGMVGGSYPLEYSSSGYQYGGYCGSGSGGGGTGLGHNQSEMGFGSAGTMSPQHFGGFFETSGVDIGSEDTSRHQEFGGPTSGRYGGSVVPSGVGRHLIQHAQGSLLGRYRDMQDMIDYGVQCHTGMYGADNYMMSSDSRQRLNADTVGCKPEVVINEHKTRAVGSLDSLSLQQDNHCGGLPQSSRGETCGTEKIAVDHRLQHQHQPPVNKFKNNNSVIFPSQMYGTSACTSGGVGEGINPQGGHFMDSAVSGGGGGGGGGGGALNVEESRRMLNEDGLSSRDSVLSSRSVSPASCDGEGEGEGEVRERVHSSSETSASEGRGTAISLDGGGGREPPAQVYPWMRRIHLANGRNTNTIIIIEDTNRNTNTIGGEDLSLHVVERLFLL